MSSGMNDGPLEGIRVLDMATMLAGPYAATLLGDLGADVIKVESFFGDDSRHLGPSREGERTAFMSLNRNKRAVVIDMTQGSEAQTVLARLVASADIVITNIRTGPLARLGLDYESMKGMREDLIWIGITAFGPDGPYAGRPGIDFLAQGYAGLLSQNGDPSGPEVRLTIPLIDVMTSELVCSGALAALIARGKDGKGQRVEVSLLDALTHAMCNPLGAFMNADFDTPRTGNRSLYFAPSGLYRCKNGRIVLTCPSQKFFLKLCEALERDWVADERFSTIEARKENEDALDRLIEERCMDFERDELVERLIAGDILTAPINDIPDVVQDPQILYNEMLISVPHEKLGEVRVTGVPIKFRGTPGSVRRPPPMLGQHTLEVCSELGYGNDEVMRLVESGVIGTREQILATKNEK